MTQIHNFGKPPFRESHLMHRFIIPSITCPTYLISLQGHDKTDESIGQTPLSSFSKTHFEITIVKHSVIYPHKHISKDPATTSFSAQMMNIGLKKKAHKKLRL